MKIGERIRNRRKELHLSADDVAARLGVSRATIYRYENDEIENMGIDKVGPLAAILNTTPAYLMGWEDHESLPDLPNISPFDPSDLIEFRVIGSIAAGYNMEAIEEYSGEVIYVPASMLHGRDPKEFFALKVEGESMYPLYLPGDNVIVLRCSSVDSGRVAVVLYGTKATLKKVNYVYGEDWLELMPINPEYQTRRIEGQELEQCRVLGAVFGLFRDLAQ